MSTVIKPVEESVRIIIEKTIICTQVSLGRRAVFLTIMNDFDRFSYTLSISNTIASCMRQDYTLVTREGMFAPKVEIEIISPDMILNPLEDSEAERGILDMILNTDFERKMLYSLIHGVAIMFYNEANEQHIHTWIDTQLDNYLITEGLRGYKVLEDFTTPGTKNPGMDIST